jgi:hypothetical protein
MRLLLFVLFICLSVYNYAQDEMPDYRSKRESFSKMQEKEIRSDLASFTMAGVDESVGKQPLQSIPVTEYGDNFIAFEQGNIKVNITAEPFFASKHKLGYSDKYLVKIDNKPFYGDYGKVPSTAIKNVSVIMDRDTIPIPAAAFADLYNPIFTYNEGGTEKSYNSVFLSPDKRKVYIYMLKRETGGSYEVTWVIQDKTYLRRVVDYGFLK